MLLRRDSHAMRAAFDFTRRCYIATIYYLRCYAFLRHADCRYDDAMRGAFVDVA